MSQLSLALSWYAATLCTLVFALLFFVYLSFDHTVSPAVAPQYHNYRALPAQAMNISNQQVEINKTDARATLIQDFFKGYKSPLADYAQVFVEVADKYKIDFRLLPSIAMQESNGAKIMPHNSYNPFGYGIYGGKVLRFKSFEEGIDRVGRGLQQDYIKQGLKTPEEIMVKYTPPSLAKGGAWAKGVSSFMLELQ